MTNLWDKNQGFEGPPESHEAHERFRVFLKLGSRRTVAELARRIGVTKQAIGQVARRYNWKERAEAWDAYQALTTKPEEIEDIDLDALKKSDPNPSLKAKKEDYTALPPPPFPPAFAPLEKENKPVLRAEIVEELSKTDDGIDQLNESIEYRAEFRAIGKEMLSDAIDIRQMAKVAHIDLSIIWREHVGAIQQKDFKKAAFYAAQIKDLTPQYWRLRELVRGYRQDASVHWGNSAALHELIQKAYGGK
jgi:hypothetical protein